MNSTQQQQTPYLSSGVKCSISLAVFSRMNLVDIGTEILNTNNLPFAFAKVKDSLFLGFERNPTP